MTEIFTKKIFFETLENHRKLNNQKLYQKLIYYFHLLVQGGQGSGILVQGEHASNFLQVI